MFGPGLDQPLVEYAGSGTTSRTFLSADERGSIIARSASTGALIAANSYDEYGIPGSANAGLFQYTGQVWISQLGFYYYKARMYSPTLGRFMQTDPLGYGGDGPNLYAYVLNDPVNSADPAGTKTGTGGTINVTACNAGDHNIGSGGLLICVPNDIGSEYGTTEPTPGGNVEREGVGRPDRQKQNQKQKQKQKPTKTQCFKQAFEKDGLSLVLDGLALIPGGGEAGAAGKTTAALVVLLDSAFRGNGLGAGLSAAGGSLEIAREAGHAGLLSKSFAEAVPVLGTFVGAYAFTNDIIDFEEDYNDCLAGG